MPIEELEFYTIAYLSYIHCVPSIQYFFRHDHDRIWVKRITYPLVQERPCIHLYKCEFISTSILVFKNNLDRHPLRLNYTRCYFSKKKTQFAENYLFPDNVICIQEEYRGRNFVNCWKVQICQCTVRTSTSVVYHVNHYYLRIL